jgi:predicted GIY-YIG superfamily endonuclease
MHYVYLLQSQAQPNQRYIGLSSDLKRRMADHNAGRSPHTSKYRPWTLTTYLAFNEKTRAAAFESYLKTGSGRAFANRHLWPKPDMA